MGALAWAAAHPRDVAGIYLIDGGTGSLGREMSWPEVRERLAPPHLTGMPLATFRAMIPSFWDGAVPITPEVEAIVLSLMRVRSDDTISPHLRRASHLKILRAIWEQDAIALHGRLRGPAHALLAHAGGTAGTAAGAERRRAVRLALRSVGAPTTVSGIEGIHDLPLQHPGPVADRLLRWAGTAVR
jgi:pimeloyl-ACP methyl ester carboxylesterase